MQAGAVQLKLLADIADLQAKMRQVPGLVGGAMDRVSSEVQRATGILAAFGVALSAGAIVLWGRSIINGLDALDEMSSRIGVSVEDLSSLGLAYKQAGMGPEQMGATLARLQKEMADGSKELEMLGVKTKNADGTLRNVGDVLKDTAEKFAGTKTEINGVEVRMGGLEDGAEKTALAMAIFGKSAGPEMVGLLNTGKDGIEEMTAMAEKLGLVVSTQTAAQAAAFNDTLELLGLGVTGVGQGIAAQLLPTLQTLAGEFLTSMTEGDRLRNTAEVLAAGLKILYTVAAGIVEVFSTVGKTLGAAAAQAVAMWKGKFAEAKRIGDQWKTDVADGWRATSKSIVAAWESQGNAAVAGAARINGAQRNIVAELKAREAAEKESKAAAEKEQNAYIDLITSIQTKVAEVRAEIAGTDKLSESQKIQIKLTQDLASGKLKLSAAHQTAVAVAIKELAAQEQVKKASDEVLKQLEAARALRMKSIGEMESVVSSLAGQNEQMRQEIELIGLTEVQQLRLVQARNAATIAIKQATLAEMERDSVITGTMTREEIALRGEIELLQQRNNLLGDKFALTQMAEAARKAGEEWTSMWASIDQTAHDTFVNIFEGGQDVFTKLGNTIKSAVLDLLYQMTIKRWIINIQASVSGGATGSLADVIAGGSSGGTGWLSNIMSMGKLAGGTFGMGLNAGFSALFGEAGLMGALDAGGIALGAGNLLGGLGTIAGALGPVALGIGAIVSLVKSLDDSGTPHGGSMASYSAAGGLSTSQTHGAFGMGFGGVDLNESVKSFVSGLSTSIVGILDSVSKSFGGKGGYSVATGFADDSSKDGAWGGLLIKQFEEVLVNWNDSRQSKWAPKEFADGEAGQKEYLAALAKDVTGVLKEMDLPRWAQDTLDALGDTPAIEDLASAIDAINATKAALDVMAKNLVGFAGYSDEAASALMKASGGIGNLAANASTFYDLYYSEEEKRANATRDVTAALAAVNVELPANEKAYRALVEQYMAMGTAGADTLAVLLGMAGAFHEISQDDGTAADVETLASALEKLRNPVRSLGDIAQNIIDLEEELWQAQNEGDTAAIRERQLAGLSEAEQAILRQIWALKDLKDANEAAAAAAAAAAAQEKAIADERAGIERDILNLQGDTAALRQLELAGLDPANRALKEHYYALLDEAAAAQKAAQVASERAGIERDILNLQGDTAALRQLELAGLDPANRALKEHYYALLDEKNAAEAAASAVRAAAAEHASLQERLWQIEGNTGALREAALAKLLDDESRDLQRRIWAAEDEAAARQAAASAADAAANAAAQWAQQQVQAAQQIKAAWQGISDSIIDEIKRIRGEMAGSVMESYAQAQAAFEIATAQARAGDQDAAKSLPALSQAMLELAEKTAQSEAELSIIRARTASSLIQTNGGIAGRYGLSVPGYDVGTNYIPFDHLALLHEGEAVVPKAYNPAAGAVTGGTSAATEMRLERIEAALIGMAVNVGKTQQQLYRWSTGGVPIKNQEGEKIATTAA